MWVRVYEDEYVWMSMWGCIYEDMNMWSSVCDDEFSCMFWWVHMWGWVCDWWVCGNENVSMSKLGWAFEDKYVIDEYVRMRM